MAGLAIASWIGIHGVAGQKPTHAWYDWVIYGAFGVSLLVLFLTSRPARSAFARKPKIVLGDVRSFRRTATGSRGQNDLEVVYVKVRNRQDGGGDPATLANAEAWMEAIDANDETVARCQGNWLALRAGAPDPNPVKAVTLRPNGEEWGLEIGGKFIWSDAAWLAGETHPSLKPGDYTIRVSISDGIRRAKVHEWNVSNPGAGAGLRLPGISDAANFADSVLRPIRGTAALSAAAAGSGTATTPWSATAEPPPTAGSPARELAVSANEDDVAQIAKPLPNRRPTIAPEAAPVYSAEAHLLIREADPLINEAWNLTLNTKRKLGFAVLGDSYIKKAQGWNGRVVALADQTLSVRERAQVRQLGGGLLNSLGSFGMSAETIEEVVRDNVKTLEMIQSRCGG